MQRILLSALLVGAIGLGATTSVRAGEKPAKDAPGKDAPSPDAPAKSPSAKETSAKSPPGNKEIEPLNRLTGTDPVRGMLRELIDHPDKTKKLIATALPLAQKKAGLSYNAAWVLGLAAAEQKDLKATDTFLHVCADLAAKNQSVDQLAQAYLTLVELTYDAKQYDECVRVCKEVLALKTDDGKQRIVYRAFTDEHKDTDFNEYAAFDTAKPLQPLMKRYLARAYAKQGKHEQALKLVAEITKSDAGRSGQYVKNDHLKGWVLRESGALDDAAKLYEDLLGRVEADTNLDPEERADTADQLRAELCNLFVEMKKIDRAAAQYEILIKKRPDEPGFYNDLGYILADHDQRLDEAEKLVRKALALDRVKREKLPGFNAKTDHDNGAYLDSLGWVLYKKKAYPEARKYLEQAVADKKSQHIEIYDHLGDVCMAMGDRDAAIRAWEKGLEHVTDSRRDRERRAEVERKLEQAKSKSAAK